MLQSRLPMVSLLSLLTLSCMLDITLILVIFFGIRNGLSNLFSFYITSLLPLGK